MTETDPHPPGPGAPLADAAPAPAPTGPPPRAPNRPAARPRPYHHGDLRAALIHAAFAVLREDGLRAFTLRRVAARAGVSHTANRNHFGDFRGLRIAVAAEGYRMLGAALAAGLAEAGPARADAAEAVMEAYIRFALAEPALFRMIFDMDPAEDENGALAEAARAATAPFHRAARGLDLPTASPPLPEERSPGLYLWALAHGHAQLSVGGAHALAAPPDPTPEILPPDVPAPEEGAAGGTDRARGDGGGGAAASSSPAPPRRTRIGPDVEDAESAAATPGPAPPAPPPARRTAKAPEFRRIAPRMRFSQPFNFESLASSPDAPTLAAPKERR